MYVEWWMGLIFLGWWAVSTYQISSSVRRSSFADGVNVGTNMTLKVLQDRGIIDVSNTDVISSGIKKV